MPTSLNVIHDYDLWVKKKRLTWIIKYRADMKLIVVGILLFKLSANLVASESGGITIICFKYDSNIFWDNKVDWMIL